MLMKNDFYRLICFLNNSQLPRRFGIIALIIQSYTHHNATLTRRRQPGHREKFLYKELTVVYIFKQSDCVSRDTHT